MSQIIKSFASGPVPPQVPTSFVTDNGTAIPDANILDVNGVDSTVNNNNGIFTRANPNLSNNLEVVLSNRTVVTTTTTNATPTTVNIMTPTASTGTTFTVTVNAYNSAGNATAGGELIGLATCTAGGVVAIIGTNDTFDESSASLIATDWDIVTDGSQIQIQLTGVAATTLSWVVLFQYIQSPSP